MFLPLFPLSLVVYPGEDLNLHIFEPRYRQLINECLDEQKTFGIPAYVNNKMPGYGTEVHITALHKRHDDGRLDIKTKGVRVFRLADFQNPVEGKLYAGGNVQPVVLNADEESRAAGDGHYLTTLTSQLTQLYDLLQMDVDYSTDPPEQFSYRIAHKVGLSIEQEYELLTLSTEGERQRFLIQHLEKAIPVIFDMERTKERIRMNGHFKNLDPLKF